MKKTLFLFLLSAFGISHVSAGTVTNDVYSFSGSGTPISLGDDVLDALADGGESFAVSYELQDLTLNDIVTTGGIFFEITDGAKTLSVGYNSFFGFYTSGIGGMTYNNFVPYIDQGVTFLFQYDSDEKSFTFSYYMEYNSETNPHDLTEIISHNLGADNVFEQGISAGSFTINLPFGSADNIQTWTGTVSADDLANPTPAPSVPEPTTATLSLLALAGLAARRRR